MPNRLTFFPGDSSHLHSRRCLESAGGAALHTSHRCFATLELGGWWESFSRFFRGRESHLGRYFLYDIRRFASAAGLHKARSDALTGPPFLLKRPGKMSEVFFADTGAYHLHTFAASARLQEYK